MFWFIWLEGYLAICAILLHKICKYASTGFTAAQLYPCTIEATKVLMSLGFSVCAYVCDGASSYRKFFKLIATGSGDFY